MTRSELIHIIAESIRKQVLNEGDSRLNKVNRIISSEFDGLLDVNGVVRSHEYYVNGNPKTTWGEYLLYSLRHTFGLMSNSDVKYLPFVAQIAFSDEVGFEKHNNNGEEINNLRSIVQALKKDNGLFNTILEKGVSTYSGLMEIMTPYLQSKEQEENNNLKDKEYTRNDDYEIVEVTSYEQAHEIGEYTKESNLCYTQSKDTWNQYTNNGTNHVFCLLKNGWKTMKPIAGENTPYDDYGLSVIFVIFNRNGRLVTCNTRWNHAHSDGLRFGMTVDYSLNAEELSELIGDNIYEAVGINEIFVNTANAQEYLDKGYKPEDVFDKVNKFDNGFAKVRLDDKWNYITEHGKLLSPNQWFDYLFAFKNGFGQVKLNDKWNWIDTEGNILLPNQWFDYAYGFNNGFAKIKLNNKYNFINTEGKLLYPNQWFDDADYFGKDGYANVNLGDKWYYLDKEGKLSYLMNEGTNITFKQINIKMKNILHNLYLISSKYNKKYTDDNWEAVFRLFNELKNTEGIIDGNMSGGKYENYNSTNNIPTKTYNVELYTENNGKINGHIICSADGTFEHPFYPYEITCDFSESELNENKINVDFAKKNKFKINGETLDGYCHVVNEKKNMKKTTIKESQLRQLIRKVLKEEFETDKRNQMNNDWEDIDNEYSFTFDDEELYSSPIANRNAYDEKGKNSMSAMDRTLGKKDREKHFITNNATGKYFRGKTYDRDLNHTFDDEIDKYNLNIEKDFPQGHEDFNKLWNK